MKIWNPFNGNQPRSRRRQRQRWIQYKVFCCLGEFAKTIANGNLCGCGGEIAFKRDSWSYESIPSDTHRLHTQNHKIHFEHQQQPNNHKVEQERDYASINLYLHNFLIFPGCNHRSVLIFDFNKRFRDCDLRDHSVINPLFWFEWTWNRWLVEGGGSVRYLASWQTWIK